MARLDRVGVSLSWHELPRGFHREAAASNHSRPSCASGHGTDRPVLAGAGRVTA